MPPAATRENLARHAAIVDCLARRADCGNRRNAGVVEQKLGRCPGAALGSVDHNDIDTALGGDGDIVARPRRPHLQHDRDLIVGRLAQFLDLDLHVVGAEKIWMPHGRALIDALRQGAHFGNTVGHLHAEQQSTGAGLGPLPDHEFDGIGLAQMIEIKPVTRRGHLIDKLLGRIAFVFQHAAFAGTGHGADLGGAIPERRLGVGGQRAEGHGRDVDRNIEIERLFHQPGSVTQDGARVAALAISLQRQACHCCRHEGQIVECRHALVERAEATDLVAPETRKGMGLRQGFRRPPDRAAAVVG